MQQKCTCDIIAVKITVPEQEVAQCVRGSFKILKR